MADSVVPLALWRQHVSRVRQRVFAGLSDAELRLLEWETAEVSAPAVVYRVAYRAELRARRFAGCPAIPQVNELDFSL